MGGCLLIWLIGGSFWYNNIHNENTQTPLTHNTLNIQNSPLKRDNTAPITFAYGDARPVFVSENVFLLKETADFLRQNAHKAIIIKGLNMTSELKNTPPSVSNLAQARAQALRQVLTVLGSPEDVILTRTEQKDKLQVIDNQLVDAVELQIIDNPNEVLKGLNIVYRKEETAFGNTEKIKTYFDDIKQKLQQNPQLFIKITAHNDLYETPDVSEKRLSFARFFLKKAGFDMSKIIFLDKKNIYPLEKNGHTRNQRLEIRILKK